MKSKISPPCWLKVLLARKAPVGVIFRRGPSKWVQVIKWDTEKDAFEEGQWFHGRIYDERSDLSPSGRLMVYFAGKFNRQTLKSNAYTYAWTAVSKPPYLTALALWPKGDTYCGGGSFTTDRDLLLNHPPEAATPHPNHLPIGLRVKPTTKRDVLLIRSSHQNSWRVLQSLEYDYWERRTLLPAVMEKRSPSSNVKLRVERYFDPEEQWVCSLVAGQGKEFSIGIGTWADFDKAGRLVFASEGKLFSAKLKNGRVDPQEIRDFNQAKPKTVKAPPWATKW
jgi:hypothetical protein